MVNATTKQGRQGIEPLFSSSLSRAMVATAAPQGGSPGGRGGKEEAEAEL